jgi:25S rRNA (cytosine2870-C5)-methyltransferase
VNYDGRKLPNYIKGFDRILLDAPCTGLGVISRDPSIKSNRFMIDVRKNAHLQRELLRAAVDCCKPGGIIVYSTCSISVEENEAVVDYITKIRHVKIRDTGLPIEKEGFTKYKENRFNPKLALTRRVYPHVHNMDGFYIAKLQKIKDGERNPVDGTEVSKPVVKAKETAPQKDKNKKKDKKPEEKSEKSENPEKVEKVEKSDKNDGNLSRKEKNKLASNLKKREPEK